MSSHQSIRAIFGGTFNPIHRGHTSALELLDADLGFSSVHFVLSARPPHKGDVTASVQDRFNMLELALADYPHFFADETEILRPALSYTVDTVEAFKERFPNSRLVLVIGADSLLRLHTWYQINDWIDELDWVVLGRPNYNLNQLLHFKDRLVMSLEEFKRSAGGAIWVYSNTHFDISSTQLRHALNAVADNNLTSDPFLSSNIAPQVLDYIATKSLYRL